MREALLLVVVVVLILGGVASSKFALLSYIWFAVMRPDVLAWSPDRPYSFALGTIAALSCLRDFPHVLPALYSRWLLLLCLYWVLVVLSAVFSLHQTESLLMLRVFSPTMLTATLIPVVLRTKEDMRLLFLVIAFSLGLLGLKFGLWGVLAGGASFTSGYGGSLSDNNLFALGMVIGFPLCWYARYLVTSRKWKLTYLVFCIFMPAAIVMSHSRGGILSLGCCVLFLIWYSKRRILSGFALFAFLFFSVILVKDSIVERMSTLTAVEEDASAQGRLAHWRAALQMSRDYPLLGVGFGGIPYTREISRYLSFDSHHFAHNNYLQITTDSGYPAAIVFCILQFGMLLWFWRTGATFKGKDDSLYAMSMGMCAALIGFSVGSMFLSRAFYETIYYLIAFGCGLFAVVSRIEGERSHNFGANLEPLPSAASVTSSNVSDGSKQTKYKLGGRLRVSAPGIAHGRDWRGRR